MPLVDDSEIMNDGTYKSSLQLARLRASWSSRVGVGWSDQASWPGASTSLRSAGEVEVVRPSPQDGHAYDPRSTGFSTKDEQMKNIPNVKTNSTASANHPPVTAAWNFAFIIYRCQQMVISCLFHITPQLARHLTHWCWSWCRRLTMTSATRKHDGSQTICSSRFRRGAQLKNNSENSEKH